MYESIRFNISQHQRILKADKTLSIYETLNETRLQIAKLLKFSCMHVFSKEAKNRAQKSAENWIELQARIMDLETDTQMSGTARRLPIEDNREQRLINLEIPVLVRSLKSSNVELG